MSRISNFRVVFRSVILILRINMQHMNRYIKQPTGKLKFSENSNSTACHHDNCADYSFSIFQACYNK